MKIFHRFAFPVFILLFVSSCHIKKSAVSRNTGNLSTSEKKEYYSKKFGIALDRESNLNLYASIDKWYGVKYKLGACDHHGIDCSCLVNEIFKEVYRCNTPRSTKELYGKIKKINKDRLKEGDLVFFKMTGKKIDHVGIYLSEKKFVHASTKGGVMISSLDEEHFMKTFKTGGRLRCS
ncbi:MAG: NlpC/P60 family protein [Bacteroidia bacterium]